MPTRDGLTVRTWIFADGFRPTTITYDDLSRIKISDKWKAIDDAICGKGTPSLLTKCMDCKYCFKTGDGKYRCKYATHNGKPEKENCKYERKKK